MRWSNDDAFEASEAGEPIILSGAEVADLCREHGREPSEYWEAIERTEKNAYDAATVLGWLGY